MFHADLNPILSDCGASTVGENVAYGFSSDASVVQGWMDSPGHRANILKREFTSVAVAVAYDSDGVAYWAQVFLG